MRALLDGEDLPTTWVTSDGIELEIIEMEDSHLFNTLAFCVRRQEQAKALELYRLAEAYDPYIVALHLECQSREPRKLVPGATKMLEGL